MKKDMLVKVQLNNILSLNFGVTHNQLLKIKSDHMKLHENFFYILM